MSNAPQGRRRRAPIEAFEPTVIAPLPAFGLPLTTPPAEPTPARGDDGSRDAPSVDEAPAASSIAETPAPAAPVKAASARRPRAARTASKSARPGLAVRCYPDVEELWESAHDDGPSYRQILFDALEATVDELPALIHQQRDVQKNRTAAAGEPWRLFAPKAAPHPLDTLGQTRVLHIDAQYHQVIRDLQQRVGAQTPNEMYNAALRAHLGGTSS